jgi:hypothetical protein
MTSGLLIVAQSNFRQIARACSTRPDVGLISFCDRLWAGAFGEITMKKTVLAIAISAVLAAATLAPSAADARGRGVGLGIAGGLVAGALIGGAIASGPAYAYPRAYYPVAGYEPYAYGVAPAYGCPGGYWARRPLRDPYGNVVGWSRPRFFCPAGY